MSTWMEHLTVVAAFVVGLLLSAFFSGTETGFYRLSMQRLTLDAQAGDATARQLLWFARNPSYFVATTLIGNNLANYLTTFAIGWGVVLYGSRHSDWLEVLATVLLSPVIFLFGELLPKNVYYRAPMQRLRRDISRFRICFFAFLPASWPLVLVTKLIERLRRSQDRSLEVLFGRSHLARMMTHGHQVGVLSDVQGQLASGLLQIAPQSVTGSMTPVQRIHGVRATATREEIFRFAERHGLPSLSVRRSEHGDDWYGQLSVADLAFSSRPVSALIRPLPRVDHCASKLDALHVMCEARQTHALVVDGERVLGLVSQLSLTEQMFQPAPSAVPLAD